MEYNYKASITWKEMDQDDLVSCYLMNDMFIWFKEKRGINFYFPNYEQAPWQVQCKIGQSVINFWPHKLKAHIEYAPGPAKEGWYPVKKLINDVILDSNFEMHEDDDDEDFDLIE